MKNKLRYFATAIVLFLTPLVGLTQAPTLGSTANFVLFSTDGPLSNTGTSTLTGDVGTNNGTCSSFVGVSGVVHTMDAATALCATDLTTLYNQINTTASTLIPVTTLGNNQVITAGAYSLTAATTLNGTLTLDGQGNSGAVFIIQVVGAFNVNAGAVVNLINNAQACNVFWKVEGMIAVAAGASMKGTMIANNAAISLGAGTILEGRALSTTGAVSVNGVLAYIPTSCGGIPSPSITTQPVGQTVCAGSIAMFSVAATGAGLTYQWRKGSVNLVNGGNISGVTTATLIINPAGATDVASNYNVVISGSSAPSATSTGVALVVNSALSISAQASNQTICEGSLASFSIGAVGTALTYQWRLGTTNLTNTGAISGVTSAVLTINPVALAHAATNYNVVINGACSSAVTSSNVTLVVNALPSITSAPSGQTVCAGSSASFAVVGAGTGLTYQWRIGTTNLVNSGTISGATSALLIVNPTSVANAAANYNVVVSGACSPAVTSVNVPLVINTAPAVTALSSQTVCEGSTANFPVTATGTGLTYQWRLGTVNLVNAGTISGVTSSNLSISSVNATNTASNYNVVISGLCAPSLNSTNVSLTVNSLPSIITVASNQTVCSGSSASFLVLAGGTGLTYQWRLGTANLVNGGNISGATSATMMINPALIGDASNLYNVVVSGVCSPTVTSSNVILGVNVLPVITAAPANQTVCAGGTVHFPVTASGTGLTYQWRKGTVNLSNTGNISGATSSVLTISSVSPSNASINYNVVITGVCSPSVSSLNVSLVVNTAPVIMTAAPDQTSCVGSSVSFPVLVSGSSLNYQWRKGTVNLINGGNISGATSATLTINQVNLSDAGANYNLVVNGLCTPSVVSSNVSLVVSTKPVIKKQPGNQMAYLGGSVSFSVVAIGTNLSYQWRRGNVPLNNGGSISGANSPVLTIHPVNYADTSSLYNVLVSGMCSPADTSINVILWVCACVPTGIAKNEKENNETTVSIYPNPFSGSINVVVKDIAKTGTCELKIYDTTGKEVLSSTLTKQSTTIDTFQLPAGTYVYRIINNNTAVQSGKLISQ